MKTIFFGTPEYVIPIADALNKSLKTKDNPHPISAIVTQPPKPTGRKRKITYSPLDNWAHRKGIEKIYDPSEILSKKIEADIGVLAAYGKILPMEIINYFPYGIINIHPSLLPKYRGASPVQATIASGDKETGVTFIKMNDKMDQGPVISKFKEDTRNDDTLESLRDRLFKRSADVIGGLLPAYTARKTKITKQNHKKATYTTLISKDHGFVEWKYIRLALEGDLPDMTGVTPITNEWNIPFIKNFTSYYSPATIHQYIRALTPWPGVWSKVEIGGETKRIKILEANLERKSGEVSSEPSIALVIESVQLEGKNPITWKEFTALEITS